MRPNGFIITLSLITLLALFASTPQTSIAAIVEESGSLREFFAGDEAGCAYDNWISHTSEADQVGTPGNFAPPELDRETNGFGAYQVVDSLPNPNQTLADWSAIFRALIQNDPNTADALLSQSWMNGKYEVVRLDDGSTIYLMLREMLNNNFVDDNGTETLNDDVTGSFNLGWGLFVVKPAAANPQVVIEVVHPSTDFAAPYIAFDAFLTLDAGCLFINGASRNIAWSGPTYSESVSLSDPSRNARTPFHEAHKAAVDLLVDEWVFQLHGSNPYPDHDGVPSAQISVERENRTNPNVPLMSWDHFDLLSLTPNPPIAYNEQSWPYPEPTITDYYSVYYPGLNYLGRYNWRGEIPISSHVDLPGTIDNEQMVYSHIGHNYENDRENWTHIEMDEWPDVVRLGGTLQLTFLKYDPQNPTVPTYHNYEYMANYYRLIFTAAAAYLQGPGAPVQASVIEENAPLTEFYHGTTENCAYDNWVSHISEAVALAAYNDYGPVELDRQTTGFGRFQRVPAGVPGDVLLSDWRNVFDAFLAGDAAATAAALTAGGLGDKYQIVHLTDGGEEYLILREVLNDAFFDDNGTVGAGDDVSGSFSYGWGLYVKHLGAERPNLLLEAPHPCDDYISTDILMDAFRSIDAGMMFVAGAGREVCWNDTGTYANSNSYSDPTRNARHPFHVAHQAAVDAFVGELTIQLHSYDTGGHPESKSIELSAYDDPTPNPPLMDRAVYHDLISLTPEYPIAANSIGGANHSAVRVNDYYSVYYPSGSYSWQGQLALTTTVDQRGYSFSPQMLYSHIGHNQQSDPENWMHFELDEFPNVITENILSFYSADGNVPTGANYANIVEYYHPLVTSIGKVLNTAPVWTTVPNSATGNVGDLIQFSVTGSDANGDPLTITYTSGNLPQSVQFTDNGAGSGAFSWQTTENDGGDYTAIFRIADRWGFADVTVPVSVTGGARIAYAASEQTVVGTKQGSFANTQASDNSYEVLTEVVSGGSPNNRYSYLEHKWIFPFTGVDMTLHVEAFHNANIEGDDFIIAGSTDGTNFTDLLTVTKTSDDNTEQVVALNGMAAGNYYVRVKDANRTAGRRNLDSFSLDRMYITYTSFDPVMLVGNIAMSIKTSKTNVSGVGVVSVESVGGMPVAGATVSATWSGLVNANVSGTTNASGQVTFTSASLRNPSGDFILTVNNVTLANWTYDSGQNVETSDQIHVVNGRVAGSGEELVSRERAIPELMVLNSAYPNPFNSETRLTFGLPEAGAVSVTVQDVSGRKIATLTEGWFEAGYHAVTWNARGLPAGVYLLRMEASDFNAIRRVILVR